MNPPRKASSNRSSPEKESAPISLDYNHLRRLCLKHWKLLAGLMVVGFVGGYLYAASQTRIYAATSTIVVPAKDTSANGGSAAPDLTSDEMIKTYEQILQGRDLVSRVVASEHLTDDPDFIPKDLTPPITEEVATNILYGEVSIRLRAMTRLIDITVESPSPQMAQRLANRFAQEAVLQQFQNKTDSASAASDYLQREATRLQAKAAESEHVLRDYQATHNLTGTTQGADSLGDDRLKDLNQQLISAQTQVTLLEERYGPEHPKLIEAKAAVEELQNEVSKAQADAVKSSGVDSDYSTLVSEASADQAQLDSINKELRDTQTQQHVAMTGIAVENTAELPNVPVRPAKTKTAAMGGFAGLICGLCFIMGLYFMDSSIRTVSQAESTLNVPVIAAIPILAEAGVGSKLPTYSDPQSFVAESFRGLRASLILQDRENPVRTVLVGSAIPGEGKSFCAANLAVAFAQAGLKTLLIDADLRLPTLYTYFNLPESEHNNGFPEALQGHLPLETAAIQSPIPGLSLLLTTTAAESPAELLSGVELPNLLDEAASQFDRVVIDSAPLNAVSDTMLILQKTDAILLVVRAAQTPSSESKAALQKIYSSKMKPLGLILNYLAAHTLKSYAYGYSYGQKPKQPNAKQT